MERTHDLEKANLLLEQDFPHRRTHGTPQPQGHPRKRSSYEMNRSEHKRHSHGIFIDIDKFKNFNDTYGRLRNIVLKTVSVTNAESAPANLIS